MRRPPATKREIVLSWPDKDLSPNARMHWARLAKVKNRYRSMCYIKTIQDGAQGLAGPIAVKITFHPPDKRRRDKDNMIAAFKAGQDGVADAIGIDDYEWNVLYEFGGPVPHGCVCVEIETGMKWVKVNDAAMKDEA